MNKDDLFKLLDLSGKDAPQTKEATEAGELSITASDAPTTPVATNPTALDLDDWGIRRGGEVLDESDRLQALGLDEHAIADFFGAAFEPEPKLHDSCVDALRHDFVKQLIDTPEYNA